ncbi:hypothetical protein MKW92_015271 [Papaver armeniacum]|nr:hypothetical protein MKW92_015271 [Papaver armeniacum]
MGNQDHHHQHSNELITITDEKPNLLSNCLLSSAFLHTPFQPFSSSPHHPRKPNNNPLQNFQASLISKGNEFLRNLETIAAGNPVVQKLFSFSNNINDFCQMRRREYMLSNSLSKHNFAAVLPGDSVAGLVAANGVLNFLNIYNTILVVRLVLTWFPNSPPAITNPLSTICDPYLNIFRGVIPPLGGLDLSPILAFLVLNALTSAATALPAELPTTNETTTSRQDLSSSSHSQFLNLTSTQKKWLKRVCGNKSKTSPA